MKTNLIITSIALLYCANTFAENLFVSVPLEAIYDQKYALGVGITQDFDRFKLEYGQQNNSGNFKNNHSNDENWSNYTFTNTSYYRRIHQLYDIEIGTGLDRLTLKESNSNEVNELNTKIIIAKSFTSKNLEIMPSLTYDIPISDKDKLYSKHLTRNLKINFDLNYIF